MKIVNPKLLGSNIIDCKPQKGPCPNNCNQCFYNRPNAFYIDINKSIIPTASEAKDKIVRMNAGHDSNIDKQNVIRVAKHYKHFFFNTSISRFNFPGPVVWTANPQEELPILLPRTLPPNIMFVRLRVSSTNLMHIYQGVDWFVGHLQVPVVLTFMNYYTSPPENVDIYQYKQHILNKYWCMRADVKESILRRAKLQGGRFVTMCGINCADCRNCEVFYWLTIKHMKEV